MKTTNAKWANTSKVIPTVLQPLPNSHGKRIACLSGFPCGNQALESVGICRACKRKAKRTRANKE